MSGDPIDDAGDHDGDSGDDGDVQCVVTGGPDGQGSGDGPVVVLLHGFGAPGDDLVQLGEVLPVAPDVRFVFPAAPLDLGPAMGHGRAWWPIDMARLQRSILLGEPRDLSNDVPPGLAPARELLIALLDEIERQLGLSSERVVLGGFSQGAMLACDVALHTDRPLAGLVLLSGTLLAAEQWRPRMAARRGLRVFMSHGESDPMLPFAIADGLRTELAAAGCPLTWMPFGGGHEIPVDVVRGLGAFITEVTTPGAIKPGRAP
jgi:phospholipase/carboxylesterase